MSDTFSIDDSVFDRLVDGELSPTERRELLTSLDSLPDGWRRCALSFLEAQCWQDELGQLVQNVAEPENASVQVAREAAPPQGTVARRGIGWLAIAASLIGAFTLGSIVRHGEAPVANNVARDPGLQMADVVPPPTAMPPVAKADDAVTLFVRDDQGRTQPLRVPLVDAGTLEQQLGLQFQSGVPDALRSQLQDRGFDVRSKQRFAPLWIDGRPMFVPVEDTKIVPIGTNVY